MQSLLPKDLLYPAMKELAEKVSDAICILLCVCVACFLVGQQRAGGEFVKMNFGTKSVESFARVVCLLLVWFFQHGGAWWSSVSLSGGNQVDGLPPAPSMTHRAPLLP